MIGVLEGFATIALVVAVGWLLARTRVVGVDAQRTLSLVAFWVCSPALLLLVMQRTPLAQVLSPNLAVSAISVVSVAALYLIVARVHDPRRTVGDRVMGALCSSYVNAGNLGIPIAVYVLGEVAWMAPVLLLQLLVITPVVMSVLDREAATGASLGRALGSLVGNPITLGALTGLVLALTHTALPRVLAAPIGMLGDMAVPAMLLAFGVSLHHGPRAGSDGRPGYIALMVGLKLVVMPVVAGAVGVMLGLTGTALFAAVVTAALPTAQNVFTYAVRYDRAVSSTRDAVFFSTFGSLPVILLVAALFHGMGWV